MDVTGVRDTIPQLRAVLTLEDTTAELLLAQETDKLVGKAELCTESAVSRLLSAVPAPPSCSSEC